jgi:superoxide dismutase, Fe-Mn family
MYCSAYLSEKSAVLGGLISMLFVYGSMMPLRILEEIRFWKTQEKEHTVVIRALALTLEANYVKAMKEWEVVFEQTEFAAIQWIEWAIHTQMPSDPYMQSQINALLQASMEQSQAFIKLLLEMEQRSPSISGAPIVKTVIEHIIRESEYFLGVLQAVGGPAHHPTMVPSSAYPMMAPEHPDMMGISGLNIPFEQREAQISSVSEPNRLAAEPVNPTITGESSWSNHLPQQEPVPIGGHKLPPLPYTYDALEPYIDSTTMKIHHDKHHLSYVDGLNKAEKALDKARKTGDFDLVKHWERELAFNGAGHYLHTIFWNVMTPRGGGPAIGPVAAEIQKSFGSFDSFKKQFSSAAEKVEGGGWTILVWSPRSHRLEILQAEKHQNLSQWDVIPLLPLDVWEHAYYLKHQNDRAKYIDAWWNTVNWSHVNERFEKARSVLWPPY